MRWKSWRVAVPVALLALGALLVGARAQDKAEEFKSKTFELKEKGKGDVTLTFPAGKEASVSVRCTKKTDVNLFVYDDAKKVVAKDDSPGPDCDVKFTPKAAGKYTLEVVNLGPGDNSCTLKVEFAKK
jgi:hypothetical protein